MCPYKYYHVMKQSKDKKQWRYQMVQKALEDLRAYVGDYLKEEIAAEALTQNIPAFHEFLRVAAITSSELINYMNIARETGVTHRAIRTYFDIWEDTYLGFRIPPWEKSPNRRMITTGKFYLFDVGVTNYLAQRQPRLDSAEFGKSFEHYVLMELKDYQAYKKPDLPIAFWRTSTGRKVDFILGDKDLAIEINPNFAIAKFAPKGFKDKIRQGFCLFCPETCEACPGLIPAILRIAGDKVIPDFLPR